MVQSDKIDSLDFVKATLVSGEPIFINELKIDSFYLSNNECVVVFESGNELRVQKIFFENIVKAIK